MLRETVPAPSRSESSRRRGYSGSALFIYDEAGHSDRLEGFRGKPERALCACAESLPLYSEVSPLLFHGADSQVKGQPIRVSSESPFFAAEGGHVTSGGAEHRGADLRVNRSERMTIEGTLPKGGGRKNEQASVRNVCV